jgi:hypothetical protein
MYFPIFFFFFFSKNEQFEDEHSKNCTKPSAILEKIENYELFEKTNFHLEKWIAKIKQILMSKDEYPFYQKTKDEDMQTLYELLKLGKHLLGIFSI